MIIHNPILTGSFVVNGTDVSSITGSAANLAALNIFTASVATTGSNNFVGNQVVSGSLTVTGSITTPGTLTAQTLVVQTITSSVDFVTGSTRFGSLAANTHVFSGSVTMNPGGLFVSSSGNIGVGTTNPQVKFHISGSTDYNTMFSSDSNRSGWVITTPGTSTPAGSGLVLASDGSFRLGNATQYQVAMYTNNEVGIFGGGTERMRITNSGSVGIGTTTPSSRLGVKVAGADGIVLEQDSSNAINSSRLFFSGSGQTFALFNNDGDWRFTHSAQPGNTSGTSLARFTNTGKYFRMESGTGGIQFQGTTAATNALNYYEEGTWTPSLVGGGGVASYGSNRAGWYTRIGRMVHISWFVSFSKNTLGSTLQLSGLPFTLANFSGLNYPQGPTLMDFLATTTNNITIQGANNTAVGDFIYGNGGTGQHTGLPISVLGNGSMECRGSLTYFTS